ncbi:MAG: hypothetical protein II796_01625 [Oscillospiraceae bacterium]|nr:hypothetical protein [Oscillospiraceae bacterium]
MIDIETIVDNIYIAMLLPKGSFELDKNFGSELPNLDFNTGDLELFNIKFSKIVKETLNDFDNVSYKSLKTDVEHKIVIVEVEILLEKETKIIELKFQNVEGSDFKWKRI